MIVNNTIYVDRQEQYFGGLLRSADIFPVLQTKVEEGIRFFTQLEDKVVKLQRRANDICDHQRRKRGGDRYVRHYFN